ncbi:MAG: twin-arginine translocase TatA/TatE family subunit [Leptospirales bacterium]|nr:twin-arginine translocase TatA/TatE family subunit [Leptospirales bacterium]
MSFGNIGITQLLIIFLIILVLFGAGKIPRIAKDLGNGIREFKKSLSGEDEDPKNKD